MSKLKSNPDMEFDTVEREVMRSNGSGGNSDSKPEFRAAVGLSREWEARKAGREVARNTLEKLGRDPDFFLLFSTIHYEKWGGFQEFLDGVWDVLPKGTPLIGGTVAGFMNNYGCFTRGASALAVSYPNMDVAVGVGRNTKRSPHLAAKECAGMIKKGLKNSKHENKFLFELVCSGLVPKIPGIGFKRVLSLPPIVNEIFPSILSFLTVSTQYINGREDETIEKLTEEFTDYTIIGGSTVDDNRWEKSLQFFEDKVYTNSIVALAFNTDINASICTTSGLKPTGIKMKPTKLGLFDCALSEIEDNSALDEFQKKLGWPDYFFDEKLHRKTLYYPFCYYKEGELCSRVLALVMGKHLIFTNVVKADELELYTTSGKALLDSVGDNLKSIERHKDNIHLGLVVSCTARLETLGYAIYRVHDTLLEFFRDTPFLTIYASGEDVYMPNKPVLRLNETFNLITFHE